LHPIIHLGLGIEFRQPAIIAEALAQAAVHGNRDSNYLLAVEKAATEPSSKTMLQILDEIRADKELITPVHLKEQIIKRAKQWTVSPGELEKKIAEMISTAVYYTITAACSNSRGTWISHSTPCRAPLRFSQTRSRITFRPRRIPHRRARRESSRGCSRTVMMDTQ
jgi:hypothetical protein